MEQLKKITALCFCAIVLLTGCSKFGTAKVSIVTNPKPYYNPETKEVTITAIITDPGGCNYYMEQGFCYRLDTFPNLNDVFSTQVIVNTHSETDTFSTTFSLPEVDTSYYVCAYVKNSAGLSYSNVERVSTHPEDYPETEE